MSASGSEAGRAADGLAGRVARAFVDSKLTPLLIITSVLLGVAAVILLPREEEPQIKVPMIDVLVSMPGFSAREVEERATRPMERLLWAIPGVEYLYSTSREGESLVIVRFKVGEELEASLVKLNQKLEANFDRIPPGVGRPLLKPKTIDDVPILALTWEDPEAALAHFLKAAGRFGIRVMLDLVINHTAIDSPLVQEHPEWFAKNADGSIKNPGAIDPADATKVTIWGDLAELAYWPVPDPEGLPHYWDRVVSHYLGLGFMGFRADAAYKIPGWFWARLIEEAKSLAPGVRFFAETLGCRLDECSQLSAAGFDFLYNSSKWWDFQADWFLEQYNLFRSVAPSVSFPETHDTARLDADSGGDPAAARQRYLFAAFFSTGLMLPMGFEFGFKKNLHVVKTRPLDWETPTYDLTDFITRVHRLKAGCPVLLEEDPMLRVSPKDEPVVALLKGRDREPGRLGPHQHPPRASNRRTPEPPAVAGKACLGLAGPDRGEQAL